MNDIYVKDVSLTFGDNKILDRLNERIVEGELFVLVGTTGSGKSTLLKVIAGLQYPDSGEVIVGGENICKFSKQRMLEYHKNSGFVFQNAALISNLSIYENLSLYYNYHTKMSNKEIMEKLRPYLEYVEFNDDLSHRPAELSTGERLMISIIRAIAHDPQYVFWDEPSANLDNYTQQKVAQIILNMKAKGKTMVMVSNDISFCLPLADRVGILYQGQIVESGTPEELKRSKLNITQRLLS